MKVKITFDISKKNFDRVLEEKGSFEAKRWLKQAISETLTGSKAKMFSRYSRLKDFKVEVSE